MLITINTDGVQSLDEVFKVLHELSVRTDVKSFVDAGIDLKHYYLETSDFGTEKYVVDVISNNLLSIIITRLPKTYENIEEA